MKKLVLLTLIAALLLSAASCAEHPVETTPEETTAASTNASETTASDIATTVAAEETQKLPIFDFTASVIAADGGEIAPYQSSVYFFLEGRVSDGILMFYRMEEVLPDWIEDGVIPRITLGENSSVRFACGENTLLTHSGKFRLFVQNEDGSISEVYELTDSALSDVYAYGKAHLAGKTVYVTYGCLVSDAGNADDRNDVSCIFQTDF